MTMSFTDAVNQIPVAANPDENKYMKQLMRADDTRPGIEEVKKIDQGTQSIGDSAIEQKG